jgi:hypothetical protein
MIIILQLQRVKNSLKTDRFTSKNIKYILYKEDFLLCRNLGDMMTAYVLNHKRGSNFRKTSERFQKNIILKK